MYTVVHCRTVAQLDTYLQVKGNSSRPQHTMDLVTELVPGPPYVFGALLVILAILVAAFIPEVSHTGYTGCTSASHTGNTSGRVHT